MPFLDQSSLFSDLHLFRSRTTLRLSETSRDNRYTGLLERGCPVRIGPNKARPVLKLGKYLISLHNTELDYAIILEGRIHASPITIHNASENCLFYPMAFTSYLTTHISSISIMNTEIGERIPVRAIENTLELLGYEGSEFHSGDSSDSIRSLWFVLNKYILFRKDGRSEVDNGWIGCVGQSNITSREYLERKHKIINSIIGSKVRISDNSLFKDLRFKDRIGRVVCTIPSTFILLGSNSTLKTVVVEFGEDVGGHSMDGKFRKGSCLAVPLEKIEGVEGE